MGKLNLKFTSRNIGKLEEKHGNKPILRILLESDITIDTLVEFVQYGKAGVDKETAYDIIDEALAQGVDTSDLMDEIIETLEKNGFFSKAKVMKAVETALKNQEQAVVNE